MCLWIQKRLNDPIDYLSPIRSLVTQRCLILFMIQTGRKAVSDPRFPESFVFQTMQKRTP